jgi:hypothetical protein
VTSPFRKAPEKRSNEDVFYGGRNFRGRGQRQNSFALSPDGQWLAITSWQGHIPGCGEQFFCFDLSVAHGEFFVDVFEVATGESATHLTGRFLFDTPFELLESAQWISDRHLALQMYSGKKLVLCDMRPSELPSAAAWDLARPGGEILGYWEEPNDQNFERYLSSLMLHHVVRVGSPGEYSIVVEGFSSNETFLKEIKRAYPTAGGREWSDTASGSARLPAGTGVIDARLAPYAPGPYELRSVHLRASGQDLQSLNLGFTDPHPLTLRFRDLLRGREEMQATQNLPTPDYLKYKPMTMAEKPAAFHWTLTGKNQFELIDDDHDGRPEFLRIRVGVDTDVQNCVIFGDLVLGRSAVASLKMSETEKRGIFSAYVPGSQLYRNFDAPERYSLGPLHAQCGTTETKIGWEVWKGDIQDQSEPISESSFEKPYELKVTSVPARRPNTAEFSLDCVPRTSLHFDLEYTVVQLLNHPAEVQPHSGPCGPKAVRITVENTQISTDYGSVDVMALSPGILRDSGVRAELNWLREGVSPVSGIRPVRGEGPDGEFWLGLENAHGMQKMEVLFNDRADTRGGCHISEIGQSGGPRRIILESGNSSVTSYTDQARALETPLCSIDRTIYLQLGVKVHFKPSFFGAKKIYARITGFDGNQTEWQQVGTWLASAEVAPEAVSVTPYLGSGKKQTFTFSVMDRNGGSDISRMKLVIKGFRKEEESCSIVLELPIKNGPNQAMESSQCRISNLKIDASGRDALRIRTDVEFTANFVGRRNIYAEIEDREHQSSGLTWLGSWVVPHE